MTSSGYKSQLEVKETDRKMEPDLDTELSVEGEKTSPENNTRPESLKIKLQFESKLGFYHLACHLTAETIDRVYHAVKMQIGSHQ